jgi:ABC-type transporter Mla subunit MlaD
MTTTHRHTAAAPTEPLDRRAVRAALGAEIDGLEQVIEQLEKVAGDVERVDSSLAAGAPAGEEHRQLFATIEGRLAAARSWVRESRDRLDAWADRLRDTRDPAAVDLERVRGILECIVTDQLEPARAALRNLLDEHLPEQPV